MAEVVITDESLTGLKGKVIIVTGGSSGIGLGTVLLLLSLGATVIGSDLNKPAEDTIPNSAQFSFHQANVTEWQGLVGLFKKTVELHGRVDHVFANAGMSPLVDYVSGLELDDNGDPKEPTGIVLDVNLKGTINTAALAVHYIRQNPSGGSIVVNCSTTGLQRFRAVDYSVAKHGTVGLVRGMHTALNSQSVPVRINGVAPSWTRTGIVSEQLFKKINIYTQSPSVVARAVAMLMADESRRGHLIHIDHDIYKEIDEALMLPTFNTLLHKDTRNEDEVMGLVIETWEAEK